MEELIPLTRIEQYLAKIAGEDITTPEARTRLEYYLDKITQSGGGDTPSGDFFPIHITLEGLNEYTADKTFAEIKQAVQDGLAPYVIYNGKIYFLMYDIISNTQAIFRGTPSFEYSGGEVDKIHISQERFYITSENEITNDIQSYPQET